MTTRQKKNTRRQLALSRFPDTPGLLALIVIPAVAWLIVILAILSATPS